MTTKKINLFGSIGAFGDVTAERMIAEIGDHTGDLEVHINSMGGDVYEGLSIMNALRAHKGHVTVIVDGLAASAASVIAVGGADTLIMRPGSEMMIHDAWAEPSGNAESLRTFADRLDATSKSLAEIYAEKAESDVAIWVDMMHTETWFSADEAVEAGLADRVEDGRKADKRQAVINAHRAPVFAYAGRKDAERPKILNEEDDMTLIKEIAQKLGLENFEGDKEEILAKLDEVLTNNEDTAAELPDIVYEDVLATAGEKTEFTYAGDPIEGLTFEGLELPEGVEINADGSGSVEVAEPAELEIKIRYTDGVTDKETEIYILVSEASEEEAPAEENTATEEIKNKVEIESAPAEETPVVNVVPISEDLLNELKEAAEYGRQAKKRDEEARANNFAESMFKAAKIASGERETWAAAYLRDPEGTEKLASTIASGVIPRAELGYAKETDSKEIDEQVTAKINSFIPQIKL